MSQLIIREAAIGDVQDIYEIEKLCFHDPWSLESLSNDLKHNDKAFYVAAQLDGKVVGYMGLWQLLDEGHVTNVAVRPEYTNRHIGEKILTFMLEKTRLMGIYHHTLEVRASNFVAIALYEKMGFAEEGRREGYYQDNGEDALIMWRHEDSVQTL